MIGVKYPTNDHNLGCFVPVFYPISFTFESLKQLIMKKNHLFLLAFGMVITSLLNGQTLKLSSDHPQPGETIRFMAFDLPADANVQAFFINGKDFDARDVDFSAENGKVSGTVNTSNKDVAFFLLAKDKGEETIAHLPVLLYQADRQTPVQGAHGSISLGYGRMNRYMGIEGDFDKAASSLKAEFARQPAIKGDPFWAPYYAGLGMSLSDQAAIDESKAKIEALRKNKKATEKDLMLALSLAQTLKTEDADQLKTAADQIKKKFPKGETALNDLLNQFYETKDLAQKAELFDRWKKAGGTDETSGERMASVLANMYGNAEDYAGFDKYIAMVKSPVTKAGALNGLAWNLSGDWPMEEGAAPDKALLQRAANMSHESLRLMEEVIADPAKSKPPYYTANTWKGYMKNSYGMYADTYALLMHRLGKNDDALKYQQIACEDSKFESPEMNERYCVYLEAGKGAAEAETMLAKLISEGYGTGAMKNQYKRIFIAQNTLETAADKSLAGLEEKARQKSLEELKKKMINEAAPAFVLRNLEGQEVSLESLRGKVVVLDFWATWCGPCKASFPGMQRAVTQHKDQDDVVFLFVDTWENGKDKLKNVSEFIKSNQYTFNVIMDDDNSVVEKYKVEGIPTKFVIDRAGNIRFKSVGYSGSEDGLVTEMMLMIELAGKDITAVP